MAIGLLSNGCKCSEGCSVVWMGIGLLIKGCSEKGGVV